MPYLITGQLTLINNRFVGKRSEIKTNGIFSYRIVYEMRCMIT